jgi:hypothetical protein
VTLEDIGLLGDRDRQTYTHEALLRIFSSKSVKEARQIVSSTYINYDELFEWIFENIPYVLNDPWDLSEALDNLALADIIEGRANRTQNYTLLKYMFTLMTGGVALSRKRSDGKGLYKHLENKLLNLGLPPNSFKINDSPRGLSIKPSRYLGNDWRRVNETIRKLGGYWRRTEEIWSLPYFRNPQHLPYLKKTWYNRQARDTLIAKISKHCHVSKRVTLIDLLPFIKIIFKKDEIMAREFSRQFELNDKEENLLKS